MIIFPQTTKPKNPENPETALQETHNEFQEQVQKRLKKFEWSKTGEKLLALFQKNTPFYNRLAVNYSLIEKQDIDEADKLNEAIKNTLKNSELKSIGVIFDETEKQDMHDLITIFLEEDRSESMSEEERKMENLKEQPYYPILERLAPENENERLISEETKLDEILKQINPETTKLNLDISKITNKEDKKVVEFYLASFLSWEKKEQWKEKRKKDFDEDFKTEINASTKENFNSENLLSLVSQNYIKTETKWEENGVNVKEKDLNMAFNITANEIVQKSRNIKKWETYKKIMKSIKEEKTFEKLLSWLTDLQKYVGHFEWISAKAWKKAQDTMQKEKMTEQKLNNFLKEKINTLLEKWKIKPQERILYAQKVANILTFIENIEYAKIPLDERTKDLIQNALDGIEKEIPTPEQLDETIIWLEGILEKQEESKK